MLYIFMESELVAGFFTEHSATIFVFFFLAEYGSILLMSVLISILFLGGYMFPILPFSILDSIYVWISWAIQIITHKEPSTLNLVSVMDNLMDNPIIAGLINGLTLGIKTCIIVFTFVWIRASFPRIRFDQLMQFCWTVLLPILFAFIILLPCVLYSFDAIPVNISLLFYPCLLLNNNNSYSSGVSDSAKMTYLNQ